MSNEPAMDKENIMDPRRFDGRGNDPLRLFERDHLGGEAAEREATSEVLQELIAELKSRTRSA
jgi:hypothetical protein